MLLDFPISLPFILPADEVAFISLFFDATKDFAALRKTAYSWVITRPTPDNLTDKGVND